MLLPFSSFCFSKIGRYYHPPREKQGAKGLKFQWKTKQMFWCCWNYLESNWLTRLGGFEWLLIFFFFSIFEMPVSRQTLNINNLRTTRAKSINLNTIRKIIEYSLKTAILKTIFILIVFEIFLLEFRSVLSPTQRGTGSESVKHLPWNVFAKIIKGESSIEKIVACEICKNTGFLWPLFSWIRTASFSRENAGHRKPISSHILRNGNLSFFLTPDSGLHVSSPSCFETMSFLSWKFILLSLIPNCS